MVVSYRSINDYICSIDDRITDCLRDAGPQILTRIAPYVLNQGKRLRPALVYLSALACQAEILPASHQYALVSELIHTASLFHDDVLDNAHQRRGRPAANRLLGNDAAVLIGDYLYVKALTLMETDRLYRRRAVYRTVTEMTHAEIFQSLNRFSVLSRDDYFSIIRGKTAGLIMLACQLGASTCNNKQWMSALTQFGEKIGIAFQMTDDLLDWTGGPETGKDLYCDIREGRITLPVIHLLDTCNAAERTQFIRDLTHPDSLQRPETTAKYLELMTARNVIESIKTEIKVLLAEACELIDVLPDTLYREDLLGLATGLVNRSR